MLKEVAANGEAVAMKRTRLVSAFSDRIVVTMHRKVGRWPAVRALWLIKCMVSVPDLVCGRLPSVRRPNSLAVAWIQEVAWNGAELFVLEGGPSGWIDDSVGAGRKRLDGCIEMRCLGCGGDAASWRGLVTKTGFARVKRGGSGVILGGGIIICGGGSILGAGILLGGGFGTAEALAQVVGTLLVSDYW